MKVAFDHQIFCKQRYGGVSRYFFELASRLPDYDVSDVSVVAPIHINNYLAEDSARRFTHGKYVPTNFGDLRRVVSLTNRFAVPVAWWRANPDIVHETYYSAAKPVGKARRRVVTVYDMIHELYMPEVTSVIAAKRAATSRADHIICISENTRQDLVRLHGIDPARTSVVHLGHSLTAEIDSLDVNRDHARPSLLYVGHREGYKNFATLLQAYGSSSRLRDFDLIAFGGHPPQRDELDEIRRLGISERVRFESGSDRELAARYNAASAFIYPSKYEGFGIPPLEAMSHGCPVVCSNAGSITEVVGDAGLYFDPDSADELRTALENVVTTESLQADLRTRGYSRIEAFSWDKCAAETAQIYRQIV